MESTSYYSHKKENKKVERKNAIILQVFDVPFKKVRSMLEGVAAIGFTYIQISPVQSHCTHVRAWYRLYQPTGTYIGNSLGSENDLQELFNEAQKIGIKIIVDVVLHHTSGCPICNPRGFLNWASISTKSFFGWKNPASRFNCTDWGPKEAVHTNEVLDKHTRFLKKLIDMGASGFRFDAAKHIPPSYLHSLHRNSGAKHKGILCYGEVMDGDYNVCKEYLVDGFQVADFPITFALVKAMGYGGDIRTTTSDHFSQLPDSIKLAECHDSLLGNSYKFGDKVDGILATCLLLASGQGIPFVYHTQIDHPRILAALRFNQLMYGKTRSFKSESTPNLLFIQRGDYGLAIINKSNEVVTASSLQLAGMKCGVYKELVYGDLAVQVEKGGDGHPWVKSWDAQRRGGFFIGPRESLFLVWDK